MRISSRVPLIAFVVFVVVPSSMAGSHLWRFHEVFSNADGTVQFVELREWMGADGETFLQDKWVASDTTQNVFIFPGNLSPPTGFKHLLLATSGFASLPGAPTPDYIVPDGFFSLDGDTLRYWTYPTGVMSWDAGEVPVDGVLSLNYDETTAVNSPTNYAGDTGSVVVGDPVPTTSNWGLLVLALCVTTTSTIVLVRRKPSSRAPVSLTG